MKIINDTLKNKAGTWSRKSLTAFFSFSGAIAYEIVLPIIYKTETKQYVFEGLLMLTAVTLGLTVWQKQVDKKQDGEG